MFQIKSPLHKGYVYTADPIGLAASSYLLGVDKIGFSSLIQGQCSSKRELTMRDAFRIVGGLSLTLLCCNVLGVATPNTMNIEILGSINLSVVGLNLVTYCLFYPVLSPLKAKIQKDKDLRKNLRAHEIHLAIAAIVQITLNALMLAGVSHFSMNTIAWTYVGSGIAMLAITLTTQLLINRTTRKYQNFRFEADSDKVNIYYALRLVLNSCGYLSGMELSSDLSSLKILNRQGT